MPLDDDPTLVRLALAGPQAEGAFRRLVERHAAALLAWTRHLAGDVAGGDDLAQETFLHAWLGLSTYDERKGTLRGWLFAIARNRALNERRRRRPALLPRPPDPVAPDASEAPDEAASLRLDRALAAIPAAQQAAFLLVDVHGLSLAEVAAVEQVPVGTIKSRVSRARDGLRAALSRAEERTR